MLLMLCVSDLAAQTSLRSTIAEALDAWSGRAATRASILKITSDPVPMLVTIAKSKSESDIRRTHAIALLATFTGKPSERALGQIANDPNPRYRCLGLQSLAEQKASSAVPMLISKLDDHSTCMKTVSTDPAEEHYVYVSDEAVRLLEQITGQSFGQESGNGHRLTKPWKEWWTKQKATSSKPPTSNAQKPIERTDSVKKDCRQQSR